MHSLLVCHAELVGLLFVAGRELVLDAGHQIVVVGAPDCLLKNIQPPGSFQVDLEKESQSHMQKMVLVLSSLVTTHTDRSDFSGSEYQNISRLKP